MSTGEQEGLVAPVCESQATVGLDLDLTTAVTLSIGEKIDAPKSLKAALQRLRRVQRRLSWKIKGSSNPGRR